MTNVLELATRLRGMGDDELLTALRAREVAPARISDFFDLAEALLDRDSIQRALSRLDRSSLSLLFSATRLARAGSQPSLHAISERRTALTGSPASRASGPSQPDLEGSATIVCGLLLAAADGTRLLPYDAVSDAFDSWPALGLPSETDLANGTPPDPPDSAEEDQHPIDRLAAERSFSTTAAIAELASELARQPARELSRGGVALPDARRLAAAMSVDVEFVPTMMSIAERAQLISRESNEWLVTSQSDGWLRESSVARWCELVGAWLEALPDDVHDLLSARPRSPWGRDFRSFADFVYPIGGEWLRQSLDSVTRTADALGITADTFPSTAGSILLERGPAAAAEAVQALFPAEVDRVYVQHDLSIISPGPLAPAIDARLRSMADVESRALATTYRVSSSSLNRAMAGGETAETVLEFLRDISLTGIPQPLDYLVHDTSSRYGLLRVGSQPRAETGTDSTARSYVRSTDAELLSTVEVDQNLSPLALVRVDRHRLVSRFERDVVFWALADARYAAAAEDSEGQAIPLQRARTGPAPTPPTEDPAHVLLDRLRRNSATGSESTGEDWLVRQLDIAIRSRITVAVRVAMPNGTEVDYELEPTGLGGGRLRARDFRADIERTLPLSSITALRAPDGVQ